jgi:amino acid transporter
VHPKHQSPHVASFTVSALTAAILLAYVAAGADPYVGIASSLVGLGTLGITVLQAAAAVSIIVFFRRRGDRRWFTTAAAPAIGAIGLLAANCLILKNYSVVTGTDSALINDLPWLLIVVGAAGIAVALRLRSAAPGAYQALGEDAESPQLEEVHG